MLHGIAAYNRVQGIHALIKRVETAISGVEICTSNKAIGQNGGEFKEKGMTTDKYPALTIAGLILFASTVDWMADTFFRLLGV